MLNSSYVITRSMHAHPIANIHAVTCAARSTPLSGVRAVIGAVAQLMFYLSGTFTALFYNDMHILSL